VVISHNRAGRLRTCLEAIENGEDRQATQITLIENGSTDGSAQLEPDFPDVRFMRLPRNFGLTKALNIGWRASQADYVLFMHEDVELARDTIRLLAEALDALPDAGAVAPLLVDARGNPAPQIGELPPTGAFRPAKPGDAPVEADYVSGAAIMVRSFYLKSMRKFDERYGQFGSDAEICYQIRRVGKQVLILPRARAVHHGREGASELREADFELGRAMFLWKHAGLFPWLRARVKAAFGALAGFRLRRLGYLISGQKLDGTQS
jgi:N-acetylglucosaminyl-diphospho-decaprenol L-rhamnosyltransferase